MNKALVFTSAEEMRERLRKALLERSEEAFDTFAGGEMDGTQFLTKARWLDVLAGVLEETPLPEPTDHAAEVATPARVVVSAVCPKCDIPTLAVVTLSAELKVDDTQSVLTVKGKTKAVTHRCGQLTLTEQQRAEEEGQQSFDLADIIGSPSDGDEQEGDS